MEHDTIKGIGGKTGAAMWSEIDDLVTRWVKRNPYGANWNRLYNQKRRDDLKFNKFAILQDDDTGIHTRTAISVHPELMNYIEAFYPKFFSSKENVRKFGNTYKMFKIIEGKL